MANGLLPGLLLFLVIGLTLVVTAPFVVPAIIISLLWSRWIGTAIAFAGLLWSVVVFLWSAKKAALWLDDHHPDFFADLSRRSS